MSREVSTEETGARVPEQLDDLAGGVADVASELEDTHDRNQLEEAAWMLQEIANMRRTFDAN